MDQIPNTMDALTTQIVDLRLKGYSFEEISVKTGVRPEEIVATWREYLDNRSKTSPEEEWVLQLLRLERLLTQVNDRLAYCDKAEDYEVVIKLLDRIAALQGINKDMQKDAKDKLTALTNAQTAIFLQVVFAIQNGLVQHINEAFEKHRTIKALKGELVGEPLTTVFQTEAKRVLTEGVPE